MQIKNSDFISKYHGVVTSDFWFLPNAEPWLKWPAAPYIKIQSRLKHFKLIMSHSWTLTHIHLSIATFCFFCFDCIIKHCLWWHCDNTSSLFSPCRESLESPDCLGIPADKDPRCVMNTIMQLYTWKTRSDYNQNRPHWPGIWLTWEEFDLGPVHEFWTPPKDSAEGGYN